MTELDFDTLEDFLQKYPIDEVTIPVAIQPPDEEGPYWLVQLALPMKNICLDCCIWKATTHEMSKYKNAALVEFKRALGVSPDKEKK